ncbi:hypothetical protein [Methylobacterium sp. A54F]
MDTSPADAINVAIEQLAPLVGRSSASLGAAADAFEAYAAGKAPSAMHERIATVIAEECRNAAECREVRRAFLQGFRL